MNEKVAIESLRQVKQVLDKHGIEYWLDTGTLLGAVRNGKIIPWDGDIDLGSWDKEFPKIKIAIKEFSGTEFKICISEFKRIVAITLRRDISISINITLHLLNNNEATHIWLVHKDRKTGKALDYLHRILCEQRHIIETSRMPTIITKILCKIVNALPLSMRKQLAKITWTIYEKIGCTVHLSIPSHYFNNLSKIQFYGMEFKVPAETEEYLTYRYGKWRIPKKNYIYYEEDGAIYR